MAATKRKFLELSDDCFPDDDEGVLPPPIECFTSEKYQTYGPLTIKSFDATLFPSDSLVLVCVPSSSVLPAAVVPIASMHGTFDGMSGSECSFPTTSLTPSPVPLPDIEELDTRKKVSRVYGDNLVKQKTRKLGRSAILALSGVNLYPATKKPFSTGISLQMLAHNKKEKCRLLGLLLTSPLAWNGVGVVTQLRQNGKKCVLDTVFTRDNSLDGVYQYVRPLGFLPGVLVLPSNALSYSAREKFNNQVTYIVSDVLKVGDVAVAQADVTTKKSSKRFSYGMTVIPKFKESTEVQFCLLTLLAFSFHLFRNWCRQNRCLLNLLDPHFKEPSFDDLSSAVVAESEKYLTSKFSSDDVMLLLERADALFKKLVQLFFTLYP